MVYIEVDYFRYELERSIESCLSFTLYLVYETAEAAQPQKTQHEIGHFTRKMPL